MSAQTCRCQDNDFLQLMLLVGPLHNCSHQALTSWIYALLCLKLQACKLQACLSLLFLSPSHTPLALCTRDNERYRIATNFPTSGQLEMSPTDVGCLGAMALQSRMYSPVNSISLSGITCVHSNSMLLPGQTSSHEAGTPYPWPLQQGLLFPYANFLSQSSMFFSLS